MAQAIANKLTFLKDTMLVLTEPGLTPSGPYIPHRFEVNFSDEEPKSYELKDKASYLFDQVSLLWGLSEFKNLSDSRYSEIFGEGKLISGNYHDLVKELVGLILDNLETLHWNATYQTFYDVNLLDRTEDKKVIEDVSWLLLEQALLIEGAALKNPAQFAKRLNTVVARSL